MSTSQALMALFSTDMRALGIDSKSQLAQPTDDGEQFAGLLAAQLPEQLESVIQHMTPEQLASLEHAALAADGNTLPAELQDWLQQLPDDAAPVADDALAVMGQWIAMLQQDDARPTAAVVTGAPLPTGREQPGGAVPLIATGEAGDRLQAELSSRPGAGQGLDRDMLQAADGDAQRMSLANAVRQGNQQTGQSDSALGSSGQQSASQSIQLNQPAGVQQDIGALLQRAAAEPGPAAAALFGKLVEQMDGARSSRIDDTEALDGINRAAAQSQAAAAALTARPVAAAMQPDSVPFGHQSWGQSMVERVMWMSSQNLRSVEIQLDPAELGPLEIHIQNRGQELQVQFVSQNPGVREALEAQMHRLREMFAGQGLEQAEVTVADRSAGEQARQDQRQLAERGTGQGTATGATGNTAESELTEQLLEQATQPLRGRVDYYV